ncbi:GIY-YIG nuclease family protein [Clostridium sediminicola]|uniref:GIY-YIG nuclease family protein n=1 Tax=Clostridium sediminicola TaxID=3114879 RepID=UPI0031F1D908
MKLKQKIKLLPTSPGVYLMKDSLDNIIYIGKSKNLKKRVNSYFYELSNRSSKIDKLVKNIKDLEYILCDTEFDALLLECSLIKKYKPRYNKLMVNHEKYPYLSVTYKEKYPKIDVVLQKQNDGSLYFGPFNSYNKTIVVKTILEEEFYIKTCSVNCFNKTYSGCLNYHLSKCLGPCRGEIYRLEYLKKVEMLIEFLESKSSFLIEKLESTMKEAAEKEDFVKAINIRDRLKDIEYINNQLVNLSDSKLNKKIVILDIIQKNLYKLYYIKGLNIVDREVITMDSIDTTYIKDKAVKVFGENHGEAVMNKESIDSINIINSFIKKNKDKIFYVE